MSTRRRPRPTPERPDEPAAGVPRIAPPLTVDTSTYAQLTVHADWHGAFVQLTRGVDREPGDPRPEVVLLDLHGHALQLVGTHEERGQVFFEADTVDAVEHLAKALLDAAATFRRLRQVYGLGAALAPASWGHP